jgi:hypothetical protein
MQLSPMAQAVPHAPQLVMSLVRFAHRAPHSELPAAQSQVPPAQTAPAGQALPQAPQFAGSFSGSMQVPLQLRKFGLQRQAPPAQNSPTPQRLPQLPQFVPSLRSWTHWSSQTVRPSPHWVAQLRRLQTWFAPQACPHEPQLS